MGHREPMARRPTTEHRIGFARSLLLTRAIRGIADGLMAATFASLLRSRGFDERTLGWLVSATLLGSAGLLLCVTNWPATLRPRRVLVLLGCLMTLTGVAFATTATLLLLLPLAIIGPLNPTGGDVSAFLPAEQAMLTDATSQTTRSALFARYALAGSLGAALGSFATGPTASLGLHFGFDATNGAALAPLVYATVGVTVTFTYLRARRHNNTVVLSKPTRLADSKRVVVELAAVFALDSAGGGFVGNALVAAWLMRRFNFELGQIGLVLGLASVASAASALLAPRLSRRFGLVETMVFTHLPANALLIAAGFAPSAQWAVALLLGRAVLSQLDVPARQTFVMSIVAPPERAAAAAFTNLPRSLAAASTPPIAGWLLHHSTFGWPLILGGSLKAIYDIVLLIRFRRLSTRA